MFTLHKCIRGVQVSVQNTGIVSLKLVLLVFLSILSFFPLLHLIGCFVDCMKTLTETVDATTIHLNNLH